MSRTTMAAPKPREPMLTAVEACFGLWRTFWFELPSAWLVQNGCAAAAIAAAGGPTTPIQAVALGLGCELTLAETLLS